ncbi:MAG: dihydroneopterin aldolase [Bacteroidales bacterium]|nr:dihydroneopterin aldolase [Bacteroidales bacterium]
MNKIELKDMEFFSKHGCFEEERIIGNRFIVNLAVYGDFSAAAENDRIEDAVNYQTLYDIVREEMDIPSHLLENVAQRIASHVKKQFPALEKMTVTIDKINPPLGGKLYASSVTFEI